MPILSIAEAEALVADALVRCRTSPGERRASSPAPWWPPRPTGSRGTASRGCRPMRRRRRSARSTASPMPAARAAEAGGACGRRGARLRLSGDRRWPSRELPAVAREQGIAAAAIRRSHHCGAAGHPVERLAEAGLVAILFANTPAAIAPWGGSVGVFGTNPIAFACPLPGRAPVVVDLSLSKVARGNILAAKQRGEPIPEGWALDRDGPADDRSGRGASRARCCPLGDAKGTALALMVELLAAGLTGADLRGRGVVLPRRPRRPAVRDRPAHPRLRPVGPRRGGRCRPLRDRSRRRSRPSPTPACRAPAGSP